jgi:predicted GNAT family acetyltransferase
MDISVADAPARSRFEASRGDAVAGFAEYRLRDDTITMTHTGVDDAFEGQGVGSALVRSALDIARERGLAVLPACPFVREWIARHEDNATLVPDAERARFGL